MNNYEKIKNMSITRLAKLLSALFRNSCSYPIEYSCESCVAKSICDLESQTEYRIKQWLLKECEE